MMAKSGGGGWAARVFLTWEDMQARLDGKPWPTAAERLSSKPDVSRNIGTEYYRAYCKVREDLEQQRILREENT